MANKTKKAKKMGFNIAGGNSKYGFRTVPNESVQWRLEANGKYFGDVSYNAYKAIESGTLDSYVPKNDNEKSIIEKFKNWTGYGKTPESVVSQYEKDKFGKGNIDLTDRPVYQHDDGQISTVSSMSFNENGKEILVPTIVKDASGKAKQLTEDEAIEHYHKTGEYLGKFNTVDEADEYAQRLHVDQELYYTFKANSQYKSTKNNKEKHRILGSNYYDETGYDDIMHDYINGDEDAIAIVNVNEATSKQLLLGTDSQFLKTMTPKEVSIYNYIYNVHGKDAGKEFIKDISKDLNLRQRVQSQEGLAEYAKKHKWSTSIATILLAPAKTISAVGQINDYMDDGEIDQNAGYNKYVYNPQAARKSVSEEIEKGVTGKVGSFLYQTGMSIGDSTVNTLASGGNKLLSLGTMGIGAFADRVVSAKDNGLSDEQAIGLGIIAGGAEIAFESLSFDKLTSFLKNSSKTTAKKATAQGVKQYLLDNIKTNALEELGTEGVNFIADLIISGDKSEWQTKVKQYTDEGYSEGKAFGLALRDKAVDFALTGLAGGLSGGVMSSSGAIFLNSTYKSIGKESANKKADIIAQGISYDKGTEAYQNAVKLYMKKDVSDAELGKQVLLNEIQNMESNRKTAAIGDMYIDRVTNNIVKVVGRDDKYTTVEIDNGKKITTKKFKNAQADTFSVNEQLLKVESKTPTTSERFSAKVTSTDVANAESVPDEVVNTATPADTVAIGSTYTDSKTGKTIKIVNRDTANTVVEITDTNGNVTTGTYSTDRFDRAITKGQLVQTADTEDVAENATTTTPVAETTPTDFETKTISLRRVGDSYELYGNDALALAEEVDMITTRKVVNGVETDVLVIPENFADGFAQAMADEGYTINFSDKPSVSANATTEVENGVVTDENATTDETTPTEEENVTESEMDVVTNAIEESLTPQAKADLKNGEVKENYARIAETLINVYESKGTITEDFGFFFTDGGKMVDEAIGSAFGEVKTETETTESTASVSEKETVETEVEETKVLKNEQESDTIDSTKESKPVESEDNGNESIRESVLHEDGGRRGSESAKKQAERLSSFERENKGRDATEREQFARELIERGQVEEVTYDEDTFMLVKPEAYNDDMKSMVEAAEADGNELGFFVGVGKTTYINEDGVEVTDYFDGVVVSQGKMFVQYDGVVPPQKLYKHEHCHDKWNTPEMQKAKDTILKPLTDEDKQNIFSQNRYSHYMEAYKNEDDVLQEFVCDVMAGMNEHIIENIDTVTDYWNGNETVDAYKVSEYSESIDAGGKDTNVPSNNETVDNKPKHSLSSMGATFFGDENISSEEFEKMLEDGSYKKHKGYIDYVKDCVNVYKQSRGAKGMLSGSEVKKIEQQIEGIMRVAIAAKKAGYDIFDDGETRTKKDSKKRLLFSSLEPNSDYVTSSDISTICDKAKNFTEIHDAIIKLEEERGVPADQRFFKNIDNYFILHKLLADKGLTIPCDECYVQSMRKNLTQMADAFRQLVQEENPNNKDNEQLYHKDGKDKGNIKKNNAAIRNKVRELCASADCPIKLEDLTVEMLTTADGLATLRCQAPLLYETFNSFYGQSKPKMPREATPFRPGELIAMFTNSKGKIKTGLVNKIRATGGFRLQSYSDFQIKNFVDVLQTIFEASMVGLNGHAYTKVPAFLEATEGTNLKRNISIFMYEDGGDWKLDKKNSFPMELEDIYALVATDESGNTSIIAVSQNESMSAWIMANDNVGYGIPFHKSGTRMEVVRGRIVKTPDGREILGYANQKDHTKQQTEVWKTTVGDNKENTKVKKAIDIYKFWDFKNKDNLSKKELIEKNLKRYIDECNKNNYRPKFREYLMDNESVLNETLKYAKELGFVSQDATIDDISFKYDEYTIPYGYYKFLGDFGMFNAEGKASPIEVLSLENYDFDKAVDFFKDSSKLRINELLQQFENGEVRDRYRKMVENGEMTAEQLEDVLKEKRNQIANEVVGKKYSFTEEIKTTKSNNLRHSVANNSDYLETQKKIESVAQSITHDELIELAKKNTQEFVDKVKENKGLQKRLNNAKRQMLANPNPVINVAQVGRVTKEILSEMDSTLKATDLKDEIISIYNEHAQAIKKAGGVESKIQEANDTMVRRFATLAVDIADNAEVFVESEMYGLIKSYVKETRIKIPDDAKQEADYAQFRKSHMGTFNLTNDGLDIDIAYQELCDMFPGMFDAEISHPTDQLYAIADTLENLKPYAYNPHSGYMQDAIDHIVYKFVTEADGIAATPKTKAQKMAERAKADKELALYKEKENFERKLDKHKATSKKNIQALQKKLDDFKYVQYWEKRLSKEEKAQAIKDAKAHTAEVKMRAKEEKARAIKAIRDRQKIAVLKSKIRNIVSDMKKKLDKTEKTGGYPKELVKTVAEVCSAIDFHTDRTSGDGSPTKASIKLDALKIEYDALKNNENYDFASEHRQELSDKIGELYQTVKDKRVVDLNLAELSELKDILSEISHSLSTATKQIGNAEAKANADLAWDIIESLNEKSDLNDMNKRLFLRENKIGIQSLKAFVLNPHRISEMIAGYDQNSVWWKLHDAINRGNRKAAKFVMEANKPFDDLTDGGGNEIAFYDFRTKKIKTGIKYVDGSEVEIPKSIICEMVMMWNRKDGRTHLATGGATIPDIQLYNKGKTTDAIKGGKRTKPITMHDITRLKGLLDSYDMAWIDRAHNLFNKVSKDAINSTSMELVGRELARTDNYIRMYVNQDFVGKEVGRDQDNITLEGHGSLKETKPKAKQSLLFRGLHENVFDNIEFVSKYYGLAIPIRNFNKVYRMSFRDGNDQSSVKEVIGKKFGAKIQVGVVEQYIKELQTARKREHAVFDGIRGNWLGATFWGNINSALKQTSSYWTGSALLGEDSLVKGLKNFAKNAKQTKAEIDKYSGTLYKRGQGLSTTELGDRANRKRLAGASNKITKLINEKAPVLRKIPQGIRPGNWLQAMDVNTSAALWEACKVEVAKTMEVSDENYMQTVADLWERVIEETQSNYDVMHRPESLKSTNPITQTVTMFTTDIHQKFGLLFSAYKDFSTKSELYKKGGSAADEIAKKEAGKRLSKASRSIVYSALWMGFVSVLANMVLRKFKSYIDDEEKDITAKSVAKQYATFVGEDLFNTIMPVGSSLILQAMDTFNNGYDFASVPSFDVIEDFIVSLSKIYNAATDEDGDVLGALADSTYSISNMTGIPVKNISDIIKAIKGYAGDIKELDFAHDVEDYASGNKSFYSYGDLASHIITGDTEKQKKILDYYSANGKEIAQGSLTEQLKPAYVQLYIDSPQSAYKVKRQLILEYDYSEKAIDEWTIKVYLDNIVSDPEYAAEIKSAVQTNSTWNSSSVYKLAKSNYKQVYKDGDEKDIEDLKNALIDSKVVVKGDISNWESEAKAEMGKSKLKSDAEKEKYR